MKRPPDISITRLAIYSRFLEDYVREHGPQSTINSVELAGYLDLNPHQIRKDFSYFGKFGSRGLGYRALELKEAISQILGLHKNWNLCLCGMGNLGSALFAYRGFRQMNMHIVAIFDSDKKKIGKNTQGIHVYSPEDIPEVVRSRHIDIAIIAVPGPRAQEVAEKLVKAGIRAILNFAPAKLSVPGRVKVRNVDLSTELTNLTYFLSQ